MIIAIKSEIDSRVMLYPLMHALDLYGKILVVTENKYVRRLIDDQEFSTYRNTTIIIDETGATDTAFETYGVDKSEYDFIILDNMGVTEYDRCIWLFGSKQSEHFMEDKEYLEKYEDVNNITFVQFGKVAKLTGMKETDGKKLNKPASKKKDSSEVPDGYDPAEKFKDKVVTEKLKSVAVHNLDFPTFEDIEKVEGTKQFYNLSEKMIECIYSIVKPYVNVAANDFRKGVKQSESGNSKQSGKPGR